MPHPTSGAATTKQVNHTHTTQSQVKCEQKHKCIDLNVTNGKCTDGERMSLSDSETQSKSNDFDNPKLTTKQNNIELINVVAGRVK